MKSIKEFVGANPNRTKILNGNRVLVQTLLFAAEIPIGSKWVPLDGSKREVRIEEINRYGSPRLGKSYTELTYSWEYKGHKETHSRDLFDFQTRYCLVLE